MLFSEDQYAYIKGKGTDIAAVNYIKDILVLNTVILVPRIGQWSSRVILSNKSILTWV